MTRNKNKHTRRALSLLLCAVLLMQCLPAVRAAQTEQTDPIRAKGFLQPIAQKEEVPEGWIGIYTAEDLKKLVTHRADNVILMNDVETDENLPLCGGETFTGEFDGNGHTLTYTRNVTLEDQDVCTGLFCQVAGTVRNLHVAGSVRIESSSGKVVSVCFGGIVGELSMGTMDNCVSSVVIVEDVSRFFTSGSCGGVVGKISGEATVSHCCNRGDICGRLALGGICGDVRSGNKVEIYACLNQGAISEIPEEKGTGVAYGTAYMGGILGSSGYNAPLTLKECANLGTVSAGDFTGGVAGQGQKGALFTDCLNAGPVSGASGMSGGVIGSAYACSLDKCVNVGKVTGERAGAIAGQRSSSPKLQRYYWSSDSCGGSMANTTEQTGAVDPKDLLDKTSYPALDFEEIWEMNEELGCPYPRALNWKQYENAYKTKTEQRENERYEQYFSLLIQIDEAGKNGGLPSTLHDTYHRSKEYYANREWSFIHEVNEKLNGKLTGENPFDIVLVDLFSQKYGKECYEEAVYEKTLSQASDLFSEFDLLELCRADENQKILAELAKTGGTWYGETAGHMTKLFQSLDKIEANSVVNSGLEIGGPAIDFASNTVTSVESLKKHASQFILYNAQAEAALSFSSLLKQTADMMENTTVANDSPKEREWCLKSLNNTCTELNKAAAGDCTGLYQAVGGDVLQLFTTNGASILDQVFHDDLITKNPILGGIMMGIKAGVPVAESLTDIDEIGYYAGLMDCAGLLSEAMYLALESRLVDFHKDGSYENLTKLKEALEMYFNLQMLACDYAIAWDGAINAGAFFRGRAFYDRIAEMDQLLIRKMEISELLKKARRTLLEPNTLTGYQINCPVTVHVETADGKALAVQSTGSQTVAPGLEGSYVLLGEKKESKLGVYSAGENMWVEGEEDGTMDVALWHAKDGKYVGYEIYEALPVSPGCRYTFTGDRAILNGETEFEPAKRLFNPFVDVIEGAFYYESVLWAVGHDPQITKGTDATHFSPTATCTRGQVVTFLWRAKGCPEPTRTDNPFADVKEGAFYYKAVLWAVENGVTNGVDKTHFGPDKGCTRGQVVTFLWRAEHQPKPGNDNNPFADVKGGYYYDAVTWAVEKDITKGTDPTHFSPDSTCTRGQIVTFLYRATEK